MQIIIFYHKGKELGRGHLKDMSNQEDRDQVAHDTLDILDYQIYDKFTITDNLGKNPRSAELTGYFQDKQGRIWKSIEPEKE